jgi:MoaA/NifB/PqqE/SkfB family radical SAM enzyme
MNSIDNKSFCILAWNHIAVDPEGNIKPCCIYKGSIKKPDGTIYNLGHDKIEDFYNSPEYVDIREKMLKGEPVTGCIQCVNYENYGKESRRLNYNHMYRDQLDKTSPIADTKIEYIDLRFGNLCNLQCRSCNPRNSSQLNKQVSEHSELKKYYISVDNDINQWYETTTFQDNINSQLENIKILYITGGEPTLIKKNFELLEKLIELGYSKDILLVTNSNMTNNNNKFFELLSEFKKVIFLASIDGYKTVQEYIRYPSNWGQISNNLQTLLSCNYPNIVVKVSIVVQITNIGNITQLLDYCEEFNRVAGKTVLEIDLNNLEFPNYLNVVNLPTEYKIKCWDKIEHWVKNHCKYQNDFFDVQLQALKNKCTSEVDYQYILQKFADFTTTVDKYQKLSLAEVNPELAQIVYK